MSTEEILPAILIVIMALAAIVYGFSGNWRLCVYFAAAAVLNAVVVF